MVLLCGRWHVRVNSLWLWWYCTIIVVAQGYLMYRAVLQCKEYNELPWGSEEKPVMELYVYISLVVLSIMCVPFYILTALFKVGNYANDGVRLGRDDLDASRVVEDEQAGPRAETSATGAADSRLLTLWKHVAPVCNSFHVLAAFSLLLPSVLLDAQKIKHGLLSTGAVWRSELDVIFQGDRSKLTNMVRTDVYMLHGNQTAGPSPAPPTATTDHYPAMPISPEFINYVLALVIYSLRYPAVFWYSKKIFSMVFAFQLFVAVFFYMFSFCSMAVLYKYQVTAYFHPDIALVLPHSALIILYLVTNAIVFFSSIAIFNYGYYHYNEAYRKFLQKKRRSRRFITQPTGCQGYVPHTMATITLILFVACRATIVYDAVTVYRNMKLRTIMASIVWDVCYMLLWIIMWFVFTIKQSWNFRVRVTFLAETASEIYTIRNDNVLDPEVFGNGHVTTDPPVVIQEAPDTVIPNGSANVGPESAVSGDNPGTPPSSPASALRKSGGERRVNYARVTFEENENEAEDVDLSRESPRRRSKEGKGTPSKKRKRKQGHSEKGQHKGEPITADGAEQPKNMFGDFPLQETPENTLTRSYRHSIRDKCGQYYRHSREFQSPPAAQSSPVLGQRQGEPHTGSQPAKEPPVQRRLASKGVENKIPERQSSPQRPPPLGAKLHKNPHSKPPPIGGERVLPPSHPPAHAYSKSKPKLPSHPQPHSGDAFSRTPNAARPPGMVKNNLGPAAPVVNAKRLSGSERTPSREIRIMGTTAGPGKPEMGRRDSALPSSNETSSNDSSDNVLCSQV